MLDAASRRLVMWKLVERCKPAARGSLLALFSVCLDRAFLLNATKRNQALWRWLLFRNVAFGGAALFFFVAALNKRPSLCGVSSARSSRRCLFMNKGKIGVRSPKSTFAMLQRPTIERPVDGSWRVLFRCWWSAPICPGRSVIIRIDFFCVHAA